MKAQTEDLWWRRWARPHASLPEGEPELGTRMAKCLRLAEGKLEAIKKAAARCADASDREAADWGLRNIVNDLSAVLSLLDGTAAEKGA